MRSFLIFLVVFFGVASCIPLEQEIQLTGSSGIKQDLLHRLDVQEHTLKEAILKYRHRSANFYAKVLSETQAKLNVVRNHVNSLHDTVTEKDASLIIAEVKDLEVIVPSRAQNPSPYNHQKAEALYLAVMKTNDEPSPSESLIGKVHEIVKFEKEIRNLTDSSDKLALESAYTQLSAKYRDLQAAMLSQIAVPTPEENEKLATQAANKIQELTSHHHRVQATILQNELRGFVDYEKSMNLMLPIEDATTVETFLDAADLHNLHRINIHALLAKYAFIV